MKYVVALTGKTGAGKSVISQALAELGAFIIDGDKVARYVVDAVPELLISLKEAFGDDIAPDGVLDRKSLARKAFSSPENTKLLNFIFHPAINRVIEEKVSEALNTYDVAVVDAAAIIESGYAAKCDFLVVVTAPERIRKKRIKERDGIGDEDALIRIKGQKPDSFYFENADFIIRNYEPYKLTDELNPLVKKLFGKELDDGFELNLN